MMRITQTAAFSTWIASLGDAQAIARIVARIRRMELGNAGDAKSVGGGVSEMRIDYGPGYRVYFTRRGKTVVILLCAGTKKPRSGISKPRSKWQGRSDMPLKTTPFSVLDHLKTREQQIAYLEAALEIDDPSFIAAAIGDIAKARGVSEFARETGLSREAIYKAFKPGGNPTLETIGKALTPLGLRLTLAAKDAA